jgi:hypothetical protein
MNMQMAKSIGNIRVKIIVAFAVLSVAVAALAVTSGTGTVAAARVVAGGAPLYSIPEKIGFIANVLLLQYINSDSLSYCLGNGAYLRNRYRGRLAAFGGTATLSLAADAVLALVFFAASAASCAVGSEGLTPSAAAELAAMSLRVFLAYGALSMVQAVFMMATSAANSFMAMSALGFAYCVLSPFIDPRFSIFPSELAGPRLLLNIAFSSAVFACAVFFAYKVYVKKECLQHEY